MKRFADQWLVALCLLLLVNSCSSTGKSGRYATARGEESDIRVLLVEGQETVRISATHGLVVQSTSGLKILETTLKSKLVVSVQYPSLNFMLDPEEKTGAVEGEAMIVPQAGSMLSFDGVEYDGVMKVYIGDNGTPSLLNVLPLETYLEGVLPHEIGNPGADGFDAMKSQAVAARTYAHSKMEARKSEPFDVHASIMDQVYKGRKGKTKLASEAVRDTRGRILAFDETPVRAYYSACCGGHTSDIRLVWPEREPAGYLYGIRDASGDSNRSFCQSNRYFRWRYSFTGKEMGAILRETIPKQLGVSEEEVGELMNIRVLKRSGSGRVTELVVETTEGNFTFTGDSIRWVLMTDVSAGRILPSVMFRLDKVVERDRIAYISIAGGGNGHGVGMCQNGAIGMAKKGYTYEMILKHYYPGCAVAKAY